MALSASDELVHLQAGLIVPRAAFDLVLELERRGLDLWLDGGDVLVEGKGLDEDVLADLRRLKPFVVMLLRYVASDDHLRNPMIEPPQVGPILITSRNDE